mgnify:CR=1 FL=1
MQVTTPCCGHTWLLKARNTFQYIRSIDESAHLPVAAAVLWLEANVRSRCLCSSSSCCPRPPKQASQYDPSVSAIKYHSGFETLQDNHTARVQELLLITKRREQVDANRTAEPHISSRTSCNCCGSWGKHGELGWELLGKF